jgi:hypothetical protein
MGTAMVAAPQPFARVFAGRAGGRTGTQLLTRATGGREAALGIGAAIGLVRGRDPRLWTAAQLGADLTDLAATIAVSRDLPRAERRVLLGLAGSATAVLTGALLALRGGSPSADELAGEPEQTISSEKTAEGVGSVVVSGEGQDDRVAGGDRMP